MKMVYSALNRGFSVSNTARLPNSQNQPDLSHFKWPSFPAQVNCLAGYCIEDAQLSPGPTPTLRYINE